MAVTFTDDELDLFNKNGISDDDIQATVENYRSQGLDDNAIRQKVDVKLNALKGAVVTPELKGQNGEVVTPASVDYGTKQARVEKNTWFHPVDFAKSVGKGIVHGLGSIGMGLGRQFANPIRQAIGKRPLTEYEINNLYGKIQGLPEKGGAYKTGEFVGELAPYFLLPETNIAELGKWGNRALTFGYQGGLGGELNSLVEKGWNPKENLKDAAIGAGGAIALGSAVAKGADKIARLQRAKDVMKRRNTPLAERMTAEQKENVYANRGLDKRVNEMQENPDIINNEDFYNGVDNLSEEEQIKFFDELDKVENQNKINEIKQQRKANQKEKAEEIAKINAERNEALKGASFMNTSAEINKEYDKQVREVQKKYNAIEKDLKQQQKDRTPETINLNSLKEEIGDVAFDKEISTHNYVTHAKQGKYFKQNVDDPETYHTKEAMQKFNSYVQKIKNNPEIINDESFITQFEKDFNDIRTRVPDYEVEEFESRLGELMTKARQYNEFKTSRNYKPDIEEITEAEYNALNNPVDDVAEDISPIAEEVTPKTTIEGTGELTNRGLAESVASAKGTPKEVRQAIRNDMPQYRVLHNNELTEQAIQEVEANFNNELSRLSTTKDFDALDFEKARQVSKRLFAEKRFGEALNLMDNVDENATKKGQAIQALSLWSNMTPEGAVAKANKLIKEANKKLPDKKKISLSDEDIENIKKLQETAINATDDLERTQGFARTAKYISELVPSGIGKKLKTYRNISLLLNPKTLGRNIIGNALFNTVDTGSKALASGIDSIIGLGTKQKTRVRPQLKELFSGGLQGAKTGFQEALEGIDTRGLGQRFDLGSGRVFKNPLMKGLETGLDIGLRVPDRMQYEATFAESVANMMKAQGLKEPTQEILEQAEQEALESVFQNNSLLSDTILGLRNNVINKLGLKDLGLGDLAIPYAQTPANLVQQGINYSPLGAIKGISNLVQGNQRQASLDLARALMGTGIIGTGYGLAQTGNMTPTQFEDNYIKNRNVKNNLQTLGIRPDSIGGIWYAPFQPVSTSLAIGSAIQQGENPTQAGLNTMLDLPFLQNTNRFISDVKDKGVVDAGINFASSIPAQFVPTALGQVAQYFDNVQRETYDKNKFKQGINQAIAKTPFSQLLPEKVNVKGEPIERYNSEGIKRMFDVFVNPTFINKPINDTTMQELKVLYDQTGSTKQFLPTVDKKIKFKQNGENKTIELTGEQVSEYQQVLGRELYQNYTDLMNTEEYASSDDKTRIKMLEKEKKRTKKYVDEGLFSELKNSYTE